MVYPDAHKLTKARLLHGTRKRSFPLPQAPKHFTVTEEWIQFAPAYMRLANDKPNSVYPSAVLVNEDVTREEGGLVWFTRVYSTVPPSWNDFSTYAYEFVGWLNSLGLAAERYPFSRTVKCRIANEYFLSPDPSLPVESGGVAIITGQRYVYTGNSEIPVVLLNDGGGGLSPTTPSRTAYKALIVAEDEIVAEDSTFERYLGNIWCRKTPYIIAQ